MKIYVVESCWDSQDSSPDNWYNCSEHQIDGIFSTEEKAIKYIKEELESFLEVEDIRGELKYTKETFPTDKQILDDFTYREDWSGICWYSITVEELQ